MWPGAPGSLVGTRSASRWAVGTTTPGVAVALILAFVLVLLVSVSLSGLAARTVLSTSLMFLVAGAMLGEGGFGLVPIDPGGDLVATLADIALFTVLFTDGQRAGLPDLREGWRLSGRALGLGMPLAMVGVAVPAHLLAGLDWPTAFLVGAILSPTDPVFASAIVGRSDVPLRLRRLLNVESGLNDGLALPFVLVFLATALGDESEPARIAWELLLGLVLGVVVTAVVALAWRTRLLTAEPRLQALGPFAIAVSLFAICHLTHANPYLAAFASVVYGLLVLQAGPADADKVFDLVAVTIALSIVLHSSTDVPVARALRVEPPDALPSGHPDDDEDSARQP